MSTPSAIPSTRAPGREEIRALTSLRFLAALFVFLYHFAPDAPGLLGVAAAQGHVGVTIFFVLSGFLITARYARPFARGEVGLSDYFVRRFARIVPLYLAVLALSCWALGEPPFTWKRLPEWTLTQGFFSSSLHDLVIPTSWSLTVEECFYASAPLLFVLLARSERRLGSAPAAALVLGSATVVLLLAGFLVVALVPEAKRETFGFIGTPREMLEHTYFGRFWEFAVGAVCARLWQREGGLFMGRRGPLVATAGSLACLAVIVASEGAMARAGDPWGHGWEAAWAWNAPVAIASGLLIVTLTSDRSPLARLLGLAPFVYLGRVSYALYLIQVTPLGKDLMYRWLPAEQPAYVFVLYVGMNAVAALLFEVVEEPARRAVLRIWSLRRGAVAQLSPERAPAPTRTRRLVALGVLAALLAVQQGARAIHVAHVAEGEPSLDEVRRLLGEDRILATSPEDARDGDGEGYRMALPRRWMEGPSAERRSPTRLLVYADDRPLAFLSGAEARALQARGQPAASYKRPRTLVVAVSGVRVERALTVVLQDSPGWLRVQQARLLERPQALLAAFLWWLGGVAALGALLLRVEHARPDRALRMGVVVTVAWLALDGYAAHAAPLLFLLGVLAVAAVAQVRRRPRPALA
jgi:peptidoglycan/LPS O-acetylase OafA/YrhL